MKYWLYIRYFSYIVCSALRHKSYLTLPYVTSLRDSFCLGTFAHGFIMLPPRSLASCSSWGCSLAIIQKAIYLLPTSRLQFFPRILLFCNFIFTFLHLELIIISGKGIAIFLSPGFCRSEKKKYIVFCKNNQGQGEHDNITERLPLTKISTWTK